MLYEILILTKIYQEGKSSFWQYIAWKINLKLNIENKKLEGDSNGNLYRNRYYWNIEYCESKKDPARIQSYAARFAAKEAIFKAISKVLPLDYGMEWKSIEILKEETGRPYVNLKIDNIKKQNLKIDVSLSHIKDCAVATAVAIYEE